MINLKDIKPMTVSSDVSSYSMFVYGEVKSGKTSLVNDLYKDKVLNIMTEKRYKALEGAYVQYISSWSEYLEVMRQLRKPEIKQQFDVVSVDTVDNLYGFLEKYVAAKYKEQNVGERNDLWGADWSELKNAWKDGLLKIEQEGYTPVFVSHAVQTTVQIPKSGIMEAEVDDLTTFKEVYDKKDGQTYIEFQKFVPDLKDKVMAPINKMVDNILFISQTVDTAGNEKRVIHTRSSMQWLAGSTFKGIKPIIPLSADSYKQAIIDAINLVPKEHQNPERFGDMDVPEEKPNFDELMNEAKKIAYALSQSDNMAYVTAIVDKVFGTGAKLTEASLEQVEQLKESVTQLKEIAEELKVEY